ncbi:MAG: DUF4760 domain-containing protein [Proteobacteria bacterium]|nr:DUF4760 domain-containing protein [Pseudomonadota bacterium]
MEWLANLATDLATNYGSWLVPGAITFSALLGATVAAIAVYTQRNIAKKREALKILLERESESYYQDNKKAFIKVRDSSGGFSELAKMLKDKTKGNEETNKQYTAVVNHLNHYEIISIGIRRNIIDEKICKSWMRSDFIRHWRDAAEFINAARELNSRYFALFTVVAEKWTKEDAKDKRKARRRALR